MTPLTVASLSVTANYSGDATYHLDCHHAYSGERAASDSHSADRLSTGHICVRIAHDIHSGSGVSADPWIDQSQREPDAAADHRTTCQSRNDVAGTRDLGVEHCGCRTSDGEFERYAPQEHVIGSAKLRRRYLAEWRQLCAGPDSCAAAARDCAADGDAARRRSVVDCDGECRDAMRCAGADRHSGLPGGHYHSGGASVARGIAAHAYGRYVEYDSSQRECGFGDSGEVGGRAHVHSSLRGRSIPSGRELGAAAGNVSVASVKDEESSPRRRGDTEKHAEQRATLLKHFQTGVRLRASRDPASSSVVSPNSRPHFCGFPGRLFCTFT